MTTLLPFPYEAAAASDGGLVEQPLFYAPGATDGTTQWRAETMQLVNWGGFAGRVRLSFHPRTTLISGATGAGKSTVLDAYIALMMPSDTRFNSASNDSAAGRARSDEQRNLVSYLRGKTDTKIDPQSGRERDHVLRGDDTATWGAIGMTFVNDRDERFTALRVYFLPARATRDDEITMRMATLADVIDLADLAEFAAVAGTNGRRFEPRVLKAAFPGLNTHDTYGGFATALHTRLGIGANGDGDKALRLLMRIQSGHQIRTVDGLYKEMVLERPSTYAAADKAIEHFDDLEDAYRAMKSEQDKATLLGPITGLHERLLAAQAEMSTLDTFGLNQGAHSPIAMWALRTEHELLDAAEETNRLARGTAESTHREARLAEGEADRKLEAAKEQHRNAGGDALEQLARDIQAASEELGKCRYRRSTLTSNIVALGVRLSSAQAYAELRAQGATFLAGYADRAQERKNRRDTLVRDQHPLMTRKTDLGDEKASLSGRAGRVPRRLNELRLAVAQAAGMSPHDLPFLAELIDVARDQSDWRLAIETVLAASARTMLVPLDRLQQFSRAIDPLRLTNRISFIGAEQQPHRDAPAGDPSRIASKLEFKNSPFSSWVREHVSEQNRNALCVPSAVELDGGGLRVTQAGQTRQGRRGSHGRGEQTNIIGFSSAEAIADIDRQVEQVEAELRANAARLRDIDAEIDEAERLQKAYTALVAVSWTDVDEDTIVASSAELTRRRQDILDADDTLRALAAHIDHLAADLDAKRQLSFTAKARWDGLNAEQSSLVERKDTLSRQLDELERHDAVSVDQSQTDRLGVEFAAASAPADPRQLSAFEANLGRLRQRLNGALDDARTEQTRTTTDLERTFAQYQNQWADPNLGRSVASYADYARILDNIVSTGLHERQAQWRQRLTDWSGQDLVPLSGAMDNAIQTIEDRLVPINDILNGLPFGANQDRLQIKIRRVSPDSVAAFRKELRVLSSTATKGLPEVQLELRFRQLQRFMARMRKRDDPRASAELSDRDRLLDVRRHVYVTAERFSPDGQEHLSTHSSLGDKSGGESQELVAFIVGAALRFRLGDELRTRPRFSPVFLDEGFVKSDAEFAGRGVQAWKGLGFQLIIGAPLDKVNALEPHVDGQLSISKNPHSHYSFVSQLTDAPDPAGNSSPPAPPAT